MGNGRNSGKRAVPPDVAPTLHARSPMVRRLPRPASGTPDGLPSIGR
ncbi:hypothetical protein JS278_02911 [Acidipropionibacterium virtanenii]|uniref:Uncharacterized protein n=1 Tax=Acidipropionibacterium virtanenii TaxID=2057246 RepID=A0A344UXP7_9ACTN|nr:hypothetical protein JS278_02911 [Acidipropionibacterium virtanenii]